MGMVFFISKMVMSISVNGNEIKFTDTENTTIQLEIIILASLKIALKKEQVFTIFKTETFMKDLGRMMKEMVIKVTISFMRKMKITEEILRME